jgi:HSP20 family protein
MRALSLWNTPTLLPKTLLDEFWGALPVERSFNPEWGVEESETHYTLSVDLPGLKKEDINIEVNDGTLVISGERKKEHKDGSCDYRSYGRFERRFTLGNNVQSEDVKASYKDGVLEVILAKTQEVKPKKINIAG